MAAANPSQAKNSADFLFEQLWQSYHRIISDIAHTLKTGGQDDEGLINEVQRRLVAATQKKLMAQREAARSRSLDNITSKPLQQSSRPVANESYLNLHGARPQDYETEAPKKRSRELSGSPGAAGSQEDVVLYGKLPAAKRPRQPHGVAEVTRAGTEMTSSSRPEGTRKAREEAIDADMRALPKAGDAAGRAIGDISAGRQGVIEEAQSKLKRSQQMDGADDSDSSEDEFAAAFGGGDAPPASSQARSPSPTQQPRKSASLPRRQIRSISPAGSIHSEIHSEPPEEDLSPSARAMQANRSFGFPGMEMSGKSPAADEDDEFIQDGSSSEEDEDDDEEPVPENFEELDSDLDDSEFDEPDTQGNKILAKLTSVKKNPKGTHWAVSMKHGLAQIEGFELMFRTGDADFEFVCE